jgi:hypothetical protein
MGSCPLKEKRALTREARKRALRYAAIKAKLGITADRERVRLVVVFRARVLVVRGVSVSGSISTPDAVSRDEDPPRLPGSPGSPPPGEAPPPPRMLLE